MKMGLEKCKIKCIRKGKRHETKGHKLFQVSGGGTVENMTNTLDLQNNKVLKLKILIIQEHSHHQIEIHIKVKVIRNDHCSKYNKFLCCTCGNM